MEQLAKALDMPVGALAKVAEEEAIVARITTAARERLRAQSKTPDEPAATTHGSPP